MNKIIKNFTEFVNENYNTDEFDNPEQLSLSEVVSKYSNKDNDMSLEELYNSLDIEPDGEYYPNDDQNMIIMNALKKYLPDSNYLVLNIEELLTDDDEEIQIDTQNLEILDEADPSNPGYYGWTLYKEGDILYIESTGFQMVIYPNKSQESNFSNPKEEQIDEKSRFYKRFKK